MQVQSIILTEAHRGSKVTYIPGNEHGTIASWNDTYVFVDYGKGNRPATRPEDLVWG